MACYAACYGNNIRPLPMITKVILIGLIVCLVLWVIAKAGSDKSYNQRKLEITRHKLKRKEASVDQTDND